MQMQACEVRRTGMQGQCHLPYDRVLCMPQRSVHATAFCACHSVLRMPQCSAHATACTSTCARFFPPVALLVSEAGMAFVPASSLP